MSLTQVLNPNTELAYLPPLIASEYQLFRYVVVGSTAVIIWDVLNHSVEDIKIMRRISLPSVVFSVARFLTLIFALVCSINITAPVKFCQSIMDLVTVLYPLSISSTCLLLFLRLRAVYCLQRLVIGGFFILWLGVVGTTFPVMFSIKSIRMGPTPFCVQTEIKETDIVAGVMPAVHDTLSFIAISIYLVRNAEGQRDIFGKARSFTLGEGLPRLSKLLLRDGQLYFCITSAINILTLTILANRSLSVPYRVMFTLPNAVIANTMASKIFRNTKMGFRGKLSNVEDSGGNNFSTKEVASLEFRKTGSSSDDMGQVAAGKSTKMSVQLDMSRIMSSSQHVGRFVSVQSEESKYSSPSALPHEFQNFESKMNPIRSNDGHTV